jgi:hypothetical protein
VSFARLLFLGRHLFPPLLMAVLAVCLSCGDSLDVEGHTRTGTLEITVATTGAELDGDGYLVQLDAEPVRRVASGEIIRLTVDAGTHRIELSDVSATCIVGSDNPRSVAVAEEQTVAVGFEITCTSSPQSSIQVTITTSGDDLDADGYGVALDNGELQPVGTNAGHEFSGLTTGAHIVELSGIARNCRVQDSSRVQLMLAAEPAVVQFTIECFSAGIPGWDALALPAGVLAVGVWGSSGSDLFVAGRDSVVYRGLILHYDGERWVEQFRAGMYEGTLAGIWGSSPTNVFAAGVYGLLLRYDGQQWSRFRFSPTDIDQFNSDYDVIWGSSPTNVVVGGSMDGLPPSGLVRRYEGSGWPVFGGYGFTTYGRIYDISGTSPDDVYVLGTDSPYDVEPEERWQRHAIRHYDGTSWTTSFESIHYYGMTPEQYDELRGVWANTQDDVFAVGRRGRILHYDGQSWSPMTSPTTGDLIDVWGRSSADVYAVGKAGILHYDGASWSVLGERPGACSYGANCVWGTAGDVFVVSGPIILHGRQ